MRMRWAGTTLRWTTAALAVILAACWITMLWVGVRWEGKAFKTYYSCDVARGALSIEYYDEDKSSVMSGSSWTLLKRVSPMKWGIIYSPHGGFMPTRLWIVIPLWLPFFLLCAVSAAPWGHLVHWLRRRANRCPCCGYDRTGLTRSTKCPECGAAPTDTEALARLRRGAKVLAWCSGALALSCIALGAVTSRWFIEWRNPDRSRDSGVLVWKGMVDIYWGPYVPGFYFWEPPPGLSMGRVRSPLLPMNLWSWRPHWHSGAYGWSVGVPIWLPTAVFAAGLLLSFGINHRVTRRLRLGRCPACGYDRRGLAADAKCPECAAIGAM